jgi:hypothetical protein
MMTPREAAAAAVQATRATQERDWPLVMELAGNEPALAFAGAAAMCARLAAEVRRLGGNPDAIFDKVLCLQLEATL